MGERVLYLVRHAHCDLRGFAVNQFAAGLTARGREQARFTAKRLRALDVSAIFCSTLGRAKETAEIVSMEFPKVGLRPSGLLWELPNLGPVDDRKWQDAFARGKQRGEQAFVRYVRPSRRRRRIEILISHGNLIRYFTCRALGIEPESWSLLGTSHCGITQLRVASLSHVRIICYNETAHMPERLQS